MTRSTRRISLACLDMAGTTVSDDGLVEQAFLESLDHAGVGPDDPRRPSMLEYVRETMGTSKITVFRALFGDDRAAEEANLAFEEAYDAHLGSGAVVAIPGAVEAIETLRASGIKVALLTGFSARTRDRLVASLGWSDLADLLVCPADAGRGRPYPDMILHALMMLEIDAVDAVAAVGDTAADVEAGLRAGSAVVAGVLTGADPRERLEAAGATHVLDSVADLPAILLR